MREHRIQLMLIPLLGALLATAVLTDPCQADVKVRQITLREPGKADVELPQTIEAIGLTTVAISDARIPVPRPLADMLKAKLTSALVKRLPRFAIVDRTVLPQLRKEDPEARIRAIDAVLICTVKNLALDRSDDGSRVHYQVTFQLTGLQTATTFVFVQAVASHSLPPTDSEISPGDILRAAAEAFDTPLNTFVSSLERKERVEHVLLLEAGPHTRGAIRLAAAGKIEEARAMFDKGTESEEERNSSFFGLYVLARFDGDFEKAKAYLEKAGK